ncbi:serine hydrolase domain-containing protein [Paenibacillus humicus]|uniref:serine hydrolase domain-containing protein n=1 Tax=Paenibacillus humicus TaxID=412861 RepID=UPI003F16C8DB
MSKPDKVALRLQETMDRRRIVGMACAFLIRGRLVWSGGLGLADKERGLPVSDKTIFRIASISKTVTAAALLQLADRGLCGLDDDAGKLVGLPLRHPAFPGQPVTLRQLMTHTSGLRDEYAGFAAASRQDPMIPLSELIVPGGQWHPAKLWGDKPPGDPSGYEYSNLGAIVMATIIERLSGERFDRYCRKHLFEPLGMRDSSFNLQDFEEPDRIAVLYEYDAVAGDYVPAADAFRGCLPEATDLRDYVPGANGSLFGPQGGLRTTIADLSRWLEMLAGKGERSGVRILRKETAEQMQARQWSRVPQEGFYREGGLQLQRTHDLMPGRLMIGHPGDAYGLRSGMYFDPEAGIGLIYAMNGLDDAKEGHVFTAAETELAAAMAEIFLRKKNQR